MKVTAKMKLVSIAEHAWSPTTKTLKFMCQYDTSIPEDQRFQKATPSGNAEFNIDNPVAIAAFALGGDYYVTFEPIDRVATSMGVGTKGDQP